MQLFFYLSLDLHERYHTILSVKGKKQFLEDM